MQPHLFWTQPTISGLGDRIIDIIYLLSFARIKKQKLCFYWPEFKMKTIDASHRKKDILLDNIRQYINFPYDVVFNEMPCDHEKYDSYLGAGADTRGFYQRFKDHCSFAEYERSYKSVVKDITFKDPILSYINTLPEKFISFHIRRTDKVRPDTHDGCFITNNELSGLNQLTHKAIKFYIEEGYNDFFLCSDADESKSEFIEHLQKENKNILTIPNNLEKWQQTFYDLAIMSKSKEIIISQRYSSFSILAGKLGGFDARLVFDFGTL